MSTRYSLWFFLSDSLAIFAFVLIGKSAHSQVLDFIDILETTWPFLLAWSLAGWLLGLSRPTEKQSIFIICKTTLAGWLMAVPFALVLRELIYMNPIILSFAITTFIFGALLLLVGRMIVHYCIRRMQKLT